MTNNWRKIIQYILMLNIVLDIAIVMMTGKMLFGIVAIFFAILWIASYRQ